MEETTQPQVGEINAQPQAEEVKETVQPAETETEQQPTAEPTTFELEVKYNKESKKLSRDEAVEYAQKGMNYDKLKERLDAASTELEQAKKYQEFFVKAAQETGVTPDEILSRTEKQRIAARAKAENKPVAQVEAEQRAENAEGKLKQFETDQQKRERKAAEWDEFHKALPDVKPDDIPEEIFDAWKTGDKPLLDSYKAFKYEEVQTTYQEQIKTLEERIKEMEKQQQAQEINAENASSAPGKLGSGEPADKPLTEEDVMKMPQSELDKRWPEVRKFFGFLD